MVSKYHSGLVRGLKQSLHRRMPYYEENETYIVACILDPCFKLIGGVLMMLIEKDLWICLKQR